MINKEDSKMILDSIKNRKSIRSYDKEKRATKEQITELLTAGMMAPSACALYPVEYIVVTDENKLNEITKIHPYTGMIKTAGTAIILAANTDRQNAVARGMYVLDAAASTENILLQAADMGLGTCWCGIYPNQKLADGFRKILNLPENSEPICCIAVGYPNEPFGARGKYDENKVMWL
jgi:nitroreductase